MLGVRYHDVSVEEGMVSNLTICPVSLGFTVIFGVFLSMVFLNGIREPDADRYKLRNLKSKEKLYKMND